MEEGLDKTKLFDEDKDYAWEIEKDVHLDGESEATRRYCIVVRWVQYGEGKMADLKRMVPVSSLPTE